MMYFIRLLKIKACGHDKIPPKLLKDSATVIAPILTYIFNQSIKPGIFPKDLKTEISQIYKSGSKRECCNYRPISVLSTVAKILEKLHVISVQLYEYIWRIKQYLPSTNLVLEEDFQRK